MKAGNEDEEGDKSTVESSGDRLKGWIKKGGRLGCILHFGLG
jgi:hypothetical protein